MLLLLLLGVRLLLLVLLLHLLHVGCSSSNALHPQLLQLLQWLLPLLTRSLACCC
jgi:hypothetical protein